MDKGKATALTWLDLSAAFDTVDHNILIKRLSMWYVIFGISLKWFSPYLADICQRMKINNCFQWSYPLHLVFQGVLFLDHYFLLFALLHSAQLFKFTTWTTTYMQIVHIFTFPWLPRIQIARQANSGIISMIYSTG